MDVNNIKDITIAITYRCNSRCAMCNIWQRTNFQEIYPEAYLNLPANVKNINITGGEPFLRSDFTEVFKTIAQNAPSADIVISTNGFATDLILEKMKSITHIKKDVKVAVSIDGIGERHDRIRGVEGGFEKSLGTIKKLKEAGIKTKIGFTLSDDNFDQLDKVYELARAFNIEFSLAIVHSDNNYFQSENKINKKDEIILALRGLIKKELRGWDYKRWGRAYFAYGAVKFLETGERILPDYSGELNIFIDPTGDIYPNNTTDRKMGNIKNMDGLEYSLPEKSWMMCTARRAILKHWAKAGWWVLMNKFYENFAGK